MVDPELNEEKGGHDVVHILEEEALDNTELLLEGDNKHIHKEAI